MRPDTPGAASVVADLFPRAAGRIAATLTRVFGAGALDLIEDAIQDAVVQALRTWPFTGVPDNPTAWLLRVARNRALDELRRAGRRRRHADALQRAATLGDPQSIDAAFTHEPDDELVMMLVCCHPALSREAQVAIVLKTLGGFATHEIARALLSTVDAVTRRLSRAKRTLREHRPGFELPSGAALAPRLDVVLDVLYLMFNEGYVANRGQELIRRELCLEAIRLARLLEPCAGSVPVPLEAKRQALLALMYLVAARFPARVDPNGDIVLLRDQDRTRWRRDYIAAGLRHLHASAAGETLSPLHVQAGIAARHAIAPSWEATDWAAILADYDDLRRRGDNPVVELNRSVAVAMVHGPLRAIEVLEPLASDPALAGYHLLPATLADFYVRAGNPHRAAEHYRRALALVGTEPERAFLRRRLALLA